MSYGADFQEAFVMLFAPAVSLILAFGLAGTVVIAIVRVVVLSLAPRARRYFELGGTEERR